MLLTNIERLHKLISLLSLFVLLLGLGKGMVLAYPKAVKATGDPSEIEDLIYLELAKKKSPIWYVAPTNVFLTKIVLVPEEDYLVPLYEIKLRYPLKSVLYQSFLEMNLRYLLADQIKALLDYQEQLAKLKAFQKRAKELLGPYLAEVSSSDLGYEEKGSETNNNFLNPIPIFEIGSLFSTLKRGFNVKPALFTIKNRPNKNIKEKNKNIEVEEVSGPFKTIIKNIFNFIDWLIKNKEILLGLYFFVMFIIFLISRLKR